MIVRAAEFPRDAEAVTAGAVDFARHVNLPDIVPQDRETLAVALAHLIGLPSFEIWLAEHDHRVVGGIGLLFAPFTWNRARVVMSELFIWCHDDAPKTTFLSLLRKTDERKADWNATVTEFVRLENNGTGIESVYRRMGMKPVQRVWMGAA